MVVIFSNANRDHPPIDPGDEPPWWVLLLILLGPVAAAALILGIAAWLT